ncbi:MAG: helix-turn-helix transcriptional regulator [Bacteroidetes bacterium]|nr:helix-turn-helix transcriptional regulator [Bacteroidota bacterium]
MKEKEIKIDFKPHQLILYAEKEDDTIGPVLSGSYMAKNHLADFHQIWGNLEKETFEQLVKKEISPIARFKELQELTTSELASRTGLSKRKVKRHLTYRHFMKASVKELQKYADVFNVPVANFFQIISTRQDGSWNMGHNAEAAKKIPLTINQEKTGNPLVVITNPEKNKS